jgi:hypothetical protein
MSVGSYEQAGAAMTFVDAYKIALAVVRAYARPALGYQIIACVRDGRPAVRAVRLTPKTAARSKAASAS